MAERKLGRYEIVEEIGKGGMGVVYRALDPAIGRTVAIKTILFSETASEEKLAGLRARLTRESQAAGQLSHPNIVAVYDVGAEGDTTYIVMEFVDGRTVQQALAEDTGVRAIPEALRILSDCARALDYAHGRGIVHRDVKPANVMLAADGTVKVADFGVAKVLHDNTLTQTAGVVGSPQYLAPEQLKGEAVSGQTDQYSLATLGYLLLTGRCPFEADTMAGMLTKTLFETPPRATELNPELRPAVDDVFRKGLAKDAAARYRTCAQFADALRKACEESPNETLDTTIAMPPLRIAPPPAAEPAVRPVPALRPRRKWLTIAAAVLLGMAVAVTGTYWHQRNRTDEIEMAYWSSIKDSENPVLFQAYLERYPAGQFADLAKAEIDTLKSAPAAKGVAESAKKTAVAGGGSATSAPAPSVPRPAKPPCPANLGHIPAAAFQDCLAYWTGQGYSPAAFTAYVEGGETFLTGSFQTGVSTKIAPLQTASERQNTFNELSKQGFLPDSSGMVATPAGPRFTTLWTPAEGRPFVADASLTRDELDQKMQQFHANAMVDLAGFRIDGPVRYRAVWMKGQPGDCVAQVDIAQADLAEHIRSEGKNGYRISRLSPYAGDAGVQYAGLWTKDPGAWICYYRITRAQLSERNSEAEARGFHLHHISWFDGFFSAIWWK
jgi:hypothetical protein